MPRLKEYGSEATRVGRLASVSPSAADWVEWEREYGKPLEEGVRKELTEATTRYFLWAEMELGATRKRDVERGIREVRKAANKFRSVLHGDITAAPKSDDTGFEVESRISENLAQEYPELLDRLRRKELPALIEACEKSLKALQGDHGDIAKGGEHWEIWIARLKSVLHKSKLPTRVRKDGLPSPFAKLAYAMQETFPDQLAFHRQSEQAFAQAMWRAIRKSGQ